ncbi:NAD(P)-dependent oxidoreductase [Macrococcoides caseolyticum]|uniref:NAD(P)-dependent oxidoreductase n=1 Tax=Macrococcoides caseolyticum TaxID=69966 RepID=UPI001F37366B|nr:NAD(P)-dependent oxidoreductase [Macrococcus caseolyticus]MCE4957531.1 hydroxyacid dehydrogenase [Macrococcus caseolyticus]
MKVISTINLKDVWNDLIDAYPDHEFIYRDGVDALTDEDIRTMDVIITYDSKLNEAIIERASQLKWIAWYAAGVNQLPLQYIQSKGIILTNARGVHKVQISEYIFSYIMTDYKNVIPYYQHQLSKGYRTKIRHKELFEQTICFLGTGEIPTYAAQIAQAFGMKVIGVNTNGRPIQHFDEVVSIKDRKLAFKAADIIVNVLPETKETINLLTIDDFLAMGEDALFINVGRGTITKEETLFQVLKERKIRQACLDVYYHEPLESDHPLYELDNVIMTPHITGNSKRYNERATEIFRHNLSLGIENNNKFKNRVDMIKGY